MSEQPLLDGPSGDDPKYTMSIDMSVLESLGINLYSNAAAVLSELVANAYDADATLVMIEWKETGDVVTISDDGRGMTVEEINERFLRAGYKKREVEGSSSPKWKRPFMGRKGIGKLSVFSIANVVTVYTTHDEVSSGLQIVLADLQSSIRKGKPYHPVEVPVPAERAAGGTALVLQDLKSKRADLTASALRKRLARRFDVVDPTPQADGGFKIKINGEQLTWADRQELKKLEFIWEFGSSKLPGSALPKGVTRYSLSDVVDAEKGWKVSGWIGTARTPSDLTDDEDAGSLKNIIVLARKRPIQEGIIEKLDFSRIFGSYVTGQIEADFLDVDSADDIATSDRQRLIEDDERVVKLERFLREAFKSASDTWSEERPKRETKNALDDYPKLGEWIEGLPVWQQKSARKMVGTIAALTIEKGREDQRLALFRAGILAFERLGLRQTVDDLDALGSIDAETLLPLLAQQDIYEGALWVDILRSRVEAISQLETLTESDEKEKVLQLHLFEHLWLLDPAWERATESHQMEIDLRKVSPDEFATDAEGKEIRGRIDIRYRTVAGKHLIVELKRYGVNPTIDELVVQGRKYFAALQQILEKQGDADVSSIEVVFVLGSQPRVVQRGSFATDREHILHELKGINARIALYDELVRNARHQYKDYLDASRKAHGLEELLASLGNPPSTS